MIINVLKVVISVLAIYFSYHMLTGKSREEDVNKDYKKLLERKKEIQYMLSNYSSIIDVRDVSALRKELAEIEKELKVDNVLNKVVYAVAGVYALYTLFTVVISIF